MVMKKVFIATPMFGGKATSQYSESLLKLLPALQASGVDVHVDLVGNESLIQRARNLMADRFHKSDCTHLLFIDADIGFGPEQVLRLLGAEKDIACGVYPKKHLDMKSVRDKRDGKLETSEPVTSVGLDYNLNVDYRKGLKISSGFVQCHDAATGFMLISRKAYQAVWDAHPELCCKNDVYTKGKEFQENEYRAVFECMIDPETRRYLSEDFAFIRRAQQQQQEVWCDLKSQLTHTGSFTVEN
jgi:hypothetical protein